MNWMNSRKPLPLKKRPQQQSMRASSGSSSASRTKRCKAGLRQWTIGVSMAVLLCGCAQQPVRVRCPPYPSLPPALQEYQPANIDLVPPAMLMPASVKPD